jgi:hypothetical protein
MMILVVSGIIENILSDAVWEGLKYALPFALSLVISGLIKKTTHTSLVDFRKYRF